MAFAKSLTMQAVDGNYLEEVALFGGMGSEAEAEAAELAPVASLDMGN